MGDVENGESKLGLQRANLNAHLLAQFRIEIGQRFVEQENLRLVDQCPRQRNPLLLAAGKLRRAALGESAETDDFKRMRDPLADGFIRFAADTQRESHVLEDRQMGPDRVGLKHHAQLALFRRQIVSTRGNCDGFTGYKYFTGIGLFQTGHQTQRCRLPTTRRTQQRENLAPFNGKTHAVDGIDRAEAFDHVAKLKDEQRSFAKMQN